MADGAVDNVLLLRRRDSTKISAIIKIFFLIHNGHNNTCIQPWPEDNANYHFVILSDDTDVTEYDLKDYIEHGLRIIRFRMTRLTMIDKIHLLDRLRRAMEWCCNKFDVNYWPIATSIDLPNGCISTGFISENIPEGTVTLEKDSIVEITSDLKYYSNEDAKRIFINDSYTLPTVPVGTEISLSFDKIILQCLEIVDDKTLKCKVVYGGVMNHQEIVCLRGIKLLKPPLSKRDLDIIEFAKDFQFDMVTVNAVRYSSTPCQIRALFKGNYVPLIFSVICEQQGLDNIDEIIAVSDGIILAREFLSASLVNKHQLFKLQLQISAKCKKLRKPFFISGNILEQSFVDGKLCVSDVNDIIDAIEQGAGFVLRTYPKHGDITMILYLLNEFCSNVEPSLIKSESLRELTYQIPVNAAEACIYSSILAAKLSGAKAIIVPTVTGKTVKQLSTICENMLIIAVTTSYIVARQLQFYKGVIAIVYDDKNFRNEEADRKGKIEFGKAYALKFDVLKQSQPYIVLKKGTQSSSFCDQVTIWENLNSGPKKK